MTSLKIAVRSAALALALAAVGGAVAQSPFVTPPPAKEAPAFSDEVKKTVLSAMERTLNRSAFVPGVDFTKWPELIGGEKQAIDAAKTESEFVIAVNHALQKFGFSHITLFPPDFGKQRLTQTRAGIGIRIQPEKDGIRVTEIFPDSPASKAGIHIGDLIFEADGRPIRSAPDLAGDKGQKSSIKLKRDGEVMTLDITRDIYRTVMPESITWEENRTVALVKIPSFDQGYSRQNVDDIMKEAKTAKMIVLDLRSNGGGMVINLQHLMSYFLDRQTEPLGTFIGKSAVKEYEEKTGQKNGTLTDIAREAESFRVRAIATKEPVYTGKITVLINGGTGSASEMAAAALREIKGAKVIGQKSAGAVLASMMMPLREGAGYWMQFPVTDYVTIKGFRIEGAGVEPDFMAQTAAFGQPDTALLRALELARIDG